MKTRDGIFFFRSFYDVGRKLSAKDRLAYFDAILGYAFEDIEPQVKGIAEVGFISAKPILDADKQKFLNGQKAAGFGKFGGRPKKENNPGGLENNKPGGLEEKTPNKNKNIKQEQEQETRSENQEEQKESIVADAPSPKRFIKPSLEDIAAYADSMGYVGFNAKKFHMHYESNGWKVGKVKMVNWQAAVRYWHCIDKEKSGGKVDNIHNIGDFSNERSTL